MYIYTFFCFFLRIYSIKVNVDMFVVNSLSALVVGNLLHWLLPCDNWVTS